MRILMRGLMIQGTSSDAGKSFIVTGLCRLLADAGLRVCPFKSQNMSNNSFVTADGREMSRAQAVQAEAARLEPQTFMNPILLKPRGNATSEIVLDGRVIDAPGNSGYYRNFTQTHGIEAVRRALRHIEDNFDAVIIEGAGSPAEINLNATEIVNMRIAREADVPVLLVTDVDRGGSLASVVGTLELLGTDRERVKGIIFNKFRGDISLFKPAVRWTEEYTGVPVAGVMPFVSGAAIAGEDSLSVRWSGRPGAGLNIGVVRFPGLSNYTDLDPFALEPDVTLIEIDDNININMFNALDAIILPGTKNTMRDMNWLRESGLAKALVRMSGSGMTTFGICGGYQVMGRKLLDPDLRENSEFKELDGLGLLPASTSFTSAEKHTVQVTDAASERFGAVHISGYEIHFGVTVPERQDDSPGAFMPMFTIDGRGEGMTNEDMTAAGTYIHGVFDNDDFRTVWLNGVRRRSGLPEREAIHTRGNRDAAYDALAKAVRENIDIELIMRLISGRQIN